MPELPDLTVYIEHLDRRVVGERLLDIRLASPFVLRSVAPAVEDVRGCRVTGVRRLAKQIIFELEPDLFVVIHLMISGRLRWFESGRAVPKRGGLAAFDFSSGTLIFTEASKKKRASLRLVQGREALRQLDPGGLEVLDIDFPDFMERLRASNHTLKRSLTDQRIFAGIGNAYSDEILLRAGLSPFKRARDIGAEDGQRLFAACRGTLGDWVGILRAKAGDKFPDKVTAFHDEMARPRQAPATLPGLRCPPSSASFTPRTRATIAPAARPADGCWRIGRCPGCSKTPGRSALRSWKGISGRNSPQPQCLSGIGCDTSRTAWHFNGCFTAHAGK